MKLPISVLLGTKIGRTSRSIRVSNRNDVKNSAAVLDPDRDRAGEIADVRVALLVVGAPPVAGHRPLTVRQDLRGRHKPQPSVAEERRRRRTRVGASALGAGVWDAAGVWAPAATANNTNAAARWTERIKLSSSCTSRGHSNSSMHSTTELYSKSINHLQHFAHFRLLAAFILRGFTTHAMRMLSRYKPSIGTAMIVWRHHVAAGVMTAAATKMMRTAYLRFDQPGSGRSPASSSRGRTRSSAAGTRCRGPSSIFV